MSGWPAGRASWPAGPGRIPQKNSGRPEGYPGQSPVHKWPILATYVCIYWRVSSRSGPKTDWPRGGIRTSTGASPGVDTQTYHVVLCEQIEHERMMKQI